MPIKSLSQSSLLSFQKYSSLLAGNTAYEPSAPAYDLLATEILTASAGSVEFTNLTSSYASTYQHLQLRGAINTTSGSPVRVFALRMGVSGSLSTGTTYTAQTLFGDGSTPTANSGNGDDVINFSNSVMYGDGNEYTGFVIDILDPFETTKNTSLRGLHGAASGRVSFSGGAYLNNGSITNLAVGVGGSFNLLIGSGSRISLYGRKVA